MSGTFASNLDALAAYFAQFGNEPLPESSPAVSTLPAVDLDAIRVRLAKVPPNMYLRTLISHHRDDKGPYVAWDHPSALSFVNHAPTDIAILLAHVANQAELIRLQQAVIAKLKGGAA